MQYSILTLISILFIWSNSTFNNTFLDNPIQIQSPSINNNPLIQDTIDYNQLMNPEDGFYIYEKGDWIYTFDLEKKFLFKISHGENWNQLYSAGEELFVFIDGETGKTGFLNTSGQMVIPAIYDSSPGEQPHFYDGLCSVIDATSHEFIFINKKGERALNIPSQKLMGGANSYLFPGFHEGLCIAQKNEKYGYIDKNGNWIIQPQFDRAASFGEGLAAVRNKGRVFFINKEGKQAISRSFGAMDEGSGGFTYGFFQNGKMVVNIDTSQMHIDPTDYDGPIQRDYSKDIQAEINKDGKILRIIQP